MQRKHSIPLQRKHNMTFFQCKQHSFNAKKTWHSFTAKNTQHSSLQGKRPEEHFFLLKLFTKVCVAEFKENQRMVEPTPMTWGASSYGKPPSGTNSLRSILDMAAAASGDERIPFSTHPKPQSNILSQEYLFQSTKNSKGCKACMAICLVFSTVEWTQPKEHPGNMKQASEQA
jgi:hypothetical protein